MKNISINELESITGGNDFTQWVWYQVGAAAGHIQNFLDGAGGGQPTNYDHFDELRGPKL